MRKNSIKNRIAKTINLRNTPELHFVLDQSIAYGVSMSKKIDDVVRDMIQHEDEE